MRRRYESDRKRFARFTYGVDVITDSPYLSMLAKLLIAPELDRVAALERLAALRDQRVLTEDFLAEKKRLLALA